MIRRDELASMKIFRDFTDAELDIVRMVARVELFPKEHRIIGEGEPGRKLYLVASGRVSVTTRIEGAGEEEIKLLEIGEHFGEMSLIDGSPISASIYTRDDTALFTIDSDAFDKLIEQDMPVANKILKAFVIRFSERARSTTEKIAGFYQMSNF